MTNIMLTFIDAKLLIPLSIIYSKSYLLFNMKHDIVRGFFGRIINMSNSKHFLP